MLEVKSKQHIAAVQLDCLVPATTSPDCFFVWIEAAVKSGANRPSCTEVECSWVIPQGTAASKPRKWCETSAIKDKYGQKVSRERKEERNRAKRDFQPFNESEKERLLEKEQITEEL